MKRQLQKKLMQINKLKYNQMLNKIENTRIDIKVYLCVSIYIKKETSNRGFFENELFRLHLF